MFGMGFFEILMVAVVAIIFLGPEKLPKALVDVAKFIKAAKKTMEEAKDSLDREVNLSKIKEEALAYKNSITQSVDNIKSDITKNISLDDVPDDESQELSSIDTNTQVQHTHSAKDNSVAVKPESNKTTLNFKNSDKVESKNV